jgi:hypothetical protein
MLVYFSFLMCVCCLFNWAPPPPPPSRVALTIYLGRSMRYMGVGGGLLFSRVCVTQLGSTIFILLALCTLTFDCCLLLFNSALERI